VDTAETPSFIETLPRRGYRALAYLGLARSRAAIADASGARTAYQDFLALWKDADADIPILKQAKAEYAKLQ
jgi:eukaryotic-like serine/threonine-protein kinase